MIEQIEMEKIAFKLSEENWMQNKQNISINVAKYAKLHLLNTNIRTVITNRKTPSSWMEFLFKFVIRCCCIRLLFVIEHCAHLALAQWRRHCIHTTLVEFVKIQFMYLFEINSISKCIIWTYFWTINAAENEIINQKGIWIEDWCEHQQNAQQKFILAVVYMWDTFSLIS